MKALTKGGWGADLTPWQEIDALSNRVRRMMDWNLAGPMFPRVMESMDWLPPVELVEEENEYLLTAELPGMTKDDVDVSIEDNVLTLKGEKKSERKVEDGKRHIQERCYGAFERSFTIPRNVKADKIAAEFHDGVVEVHMPKAAEGKGRRIELKAK